MIVDSSARADMGDAADMAMEWESGDLDDWTDDDREETMVAYRKETMNQIRRTAAAAAKKAAKKTTKKRAYRRKEKVSAVTYLPAPAPAPTPKANKLELLLKSITEHFPKDPSAPGLALSYLPKEYKDPPLRFYGSIRRFKGYGGTQPETIVACRQGSLLEVLSELARRWREYVQPAKPATEAFLMLDPPPEQPDDFEPPF